VILPTNLLPSAFGLQWGMSKTNCLAELHVTPLKESPSYVRVHLPIDDGFYEVGLQFDKQEGLWRIEVNLYISRSFWDNYTYEEMDRIWQEYMEHYNHVKEHCISALGPPDFSGFWGTEGYPDDQTATHLTYWDRPSGRMQVQFEHPDKEYPMFVTVACYWVSS
jgi:hypothetical protein